ncbi:hypothetical protein Tco_1428734 [Tanacetum coccineum]
MIGREILGSFCVNYFEFELLKEENPPEKSRLGIFFSKGIFEGGRVISLYTMAFVQVMQSIDGQLASTLQKCVTQECGRGGGKLLEFDLSKEKRSRLPREEKSLFPGREWGVGERTDCTTTLTDLRTTFENAFNSELKARMQNYTRYDAQSFYDAMIFNMDSLGKYMLELILHQQRTPQSLKQKKLIQTQEDHSHPTPALNVDSLKVDLVVIQNTCSEKQDSNSETASSKLVKECSLNYETKLLALKYDD